ncbi:hypothetical protein ACS0TY_033528 [Phlomoides rotata]
MESEDVWGYFNQSKNSEDSRSIKVSKRLPSAAARMIPKSTKSEDSRIIKQQHSAPQNVPDWSKRCESDDVSFEECKMTIPPHEWIARKSASSFSVCEGAGRTLKGRDLSRVRNDVLTKTGFLESSN